MRKPKQEKCGLIFCDGVHYAKGYCKRHYYNLRRFGTPFAPSSDCDLIRAITLVKRMLEWNCLGSCDDPEVLEIRDFFIRIKLPDEKSVSDDERANVIEIFKSLMQ